MWGVCIFVQNNIYFTTINMDRYTNEDIQVCAVILHISLHTIIIVTVYRSQTGNKPYRSGCPLRGYVFSFFSFSSAFTCFLSLTPPGYDLITGTVFKELSQKGIRALTQIYNAILRLEYFLRYWKIGQKLR